MENYPNLEKNKVSFKLIPWFRETMKSQCDLAFYTNKVKEEFPDLDVSMCENRFWFLDAYIPLEDLPVQHVEEIKKRISAVEGDDDDKLKAIVEYMKEVSPTRIENERQAEQRVLKGKEVLAQQLRNIEAETGKDIETNSVALFAHSNCLRHFTGEGLGEDLHPINCHRFKNGEVYEFNFEY